VAFGVLIPSHEVIIGSSTGAGTGPPFEALMQVAAPGNHAVVGAVMGLKELVVYTCRSAISCLDAANAGLTIAMGVNTLTLFCFSAEHCYSVNSNTVDHRACAHSQQVM